MAAGTKDLVADADEVVAFGSTASRWPSRLAFGGGGRGMKVAHTVEEIPELFESAKRWLRVRPWRGFVEQYSTRPATWRPAQVIADQHGNVVVAGTRDCSAAAPLPEARGGGPCAVPHRRPPAGRIHSSAKAICKEAGYYGAGTVEYPCRATPSPSSRSTPPAGRAPVTEETAGIDQCASSSVSPRARS